MLFVPNLVVDEQQVTGLAVVALVRVRTIVHHPGIRTGLLSVLERALNESDLSPEDNQEIAERVAANHEHRCPESGEEWTETVDVAIDPSGGVT